MSKIQILHYPHARSPSARVFDDKDLPKGDSYQICLRRDHLEVHVITHQGRNYTGEAEVIYSCSGSWSVEKITEKHEDHCDYCRPKEIVIP